MEDKIVKIENYEIGAQTEDDNGVDEVVVENMLLIDHNDRP